MNILRELKGILSSPGRVLPVTDLDEHVKAEPTLVPNFSGRRSIAPLANPTTEAYANRKAKEIRPNMSDTAGKIVQAAELVFAQTHSVAEFRSTVTNITAKVYRNSFVDQTKLNQELEHHILRAIRIRHLITLQHPLNADPIKVLQEQYLKVFAKQVPTYDTGRKEGVVDFTQIATEIANAKKTTELAILEHMLLKFTKYDGDYVIKSLDSSSDGISSQKSSATDSPRNVSFASDEGHLVYHSQDPAIQKSHPHRSAYTKLTREEKIAYNDLANISNTAKHYYLQVASKHKAAYVQFVREYKNFLQRLYSDEQARYLEATIKQRFS